MGGGQNLPYFDKQNNGALNMGVEANSNRCAGFSDKSGNGFASDLKGGLGRF